MRKNRDEATVTLDGLEKVSDNVDLNTQDLDGQTLSIPVGELLLEAVVGDKVLVMEKLLATYDKADINQAPWYARLMFEALRCKNRLAILSLLKAHGADFNYVSPNAPNQDTVLIKYIKGWFPSVDDILYNARYGERMASHYQKGLTRYKEELAAVISMLQYFLANGASLKVAGSKGNMVLHAMAQNKLFSSEEVEMVYRLLVIHGANVRARNADGCEPIHTAVLKGQSDVVEWLLDNSADINAVTNNGNTVLHYAAENGQGDIVAMLLKRKASTTIKNNDGKTAFDLAQGFLNERIQDLRCSTHSSEARLLAWEGEFREIYEPIMKMLSAESPSAAAIAESRAKLRMDSNEKELDVEESSLLVRQTKN